MGNREKLIRDVEKLIDKNEYNTVTIKGIRNVSRSDLETVKMYAEKGPENFMRPHGNVEKILQKYNII